VAMRRGRNKIVVTAEQERTADAKHAEQQAAGAAARERLVTATDQALTAVASTVVPALMEVREKLAPVAEQAMSQGKNRGRQAAAKSLVKGKRAAIRLGVLEEPKPKVSHKFRNMLIVLGLGGAAAAAYKMMTGKDADPAWTAGRDAAAPASPVTPAPVNESDSVPWGDTPPADQMPGMDPTAVDPVVAEPAGSDPLDHEVPATTAGPIDGSDTAPTAPLASEETVESSVPTTPDEPLEERNLT
jgi:hypothetical protein